MNEKLYLFDFDGTLTNKDSLFDFLKFSFPQSFNKKFVLFFLLFILVKIKIMKAGRVKEIFISSFLKGKSAVEIKKMAELYFESRKDTLIREKAKKYLKDIPAEYNKYIVTASLDIWVEPFADFLGARLIATQAQFVDGVFTGKFATPNCNGKEKIVRIISEIQLSKYKELYAFGDSKGDKYMLDLSTHPHFKFFG